MFSDNIRYPPGYGLKDVVAWGTTGFVVLDVTTQTVIKSPMDDEQLPLIQRERRIYERLNGLGNNTGILKYHGDVDGGGIRLDYAPNHTLQAFIKGQKSLKSPLRFSCMVQLAETLSFVHSAGVIHGDLTTANVFVDNDLNLKLADFAGSSIDSEPLLVAVTASHEYPGNLLSVQADIFAFGSVMYEVMTGERPFSSLNEDDIHKFYQCKNFPDVSCLGDLGRLIRTCWESGYSDSAALAKDLEQISESLDSIYL